MATAGSAARLTLRPAREADAAALREVFNEAVADGLTTFDSEPRSLEEQKLLIARATEDTKHPILVAEMRGWVLGWTTVQPYDLRPELAEIGEVTVYVQRSFRHYGVGKQLMQTIGQEAKQLGYRKLVGHILAENHDSLRLVRSCGWREVGRYEKHAKVNGVPRDVVGVECLV